MAGYPIALVPVIQSKLSNLFFSIDEFVEKLEGEGHTWEDIIGALDEYLSIAEEYL